MSKQEGREENSDERIRVKERKGGWREGHEEGLTEGRKRKKMKKRKG